MVKAKMIKVGMEQEASEVPVLSLKSQLELCALHQNDFYLIHFSHADVFEQASLLLS